MSWFEETRRTVLESLAIKIITCGPIPKHVAFIMDGNRRYANKNHFDDVVTGHSKGFDQLTKTLGWCNDLGIEEATVYAFSIENFKRSKEEVDGLISLAREKFAVLLKEKDKLVEKNVKIRIFGELSLLPIDLQELLEEVEEVTKTHSGHRLNVCFAYTSRQEMTSSVDLMAHAVRDNVLNASEIDEEIFNECFWSNESSPPDLLIRTSGEIRLSDFLLWQSSHTVLSFTPVLWPEFSIWHLIQAVFYYQRHEPHIRRNSQKSMISNERIHEIKKKIDVVRKKLRDERRETEVVK